jgi:hypothetical protein
MRAISSGVIWSVLRNLLFVALESCGIPFKYLLVSKPWASGEKAMNPTPASMDA